MMGTILVTVALMGQAKPAAKPARPVDPKAQAAKLIDKRRTKKVTRYVARLDGEAREAEAMRKQAEAEYKEWKSLLPYQLEARRQDLQRMSDAERNRALGRMAGAMERQAGYIYPGQSPRVGPY